jgi:hypothetical protein
VVGGELSSTTQYTSGGSVVIILFYLAPKRYRGILEQSGKLLRDRLFRSRTRVIPVYIHFGRGCIRDWVFVELEALAIRDDGVDTVDWTVFWKGSSRLCLQMRNTKVRARFGKNFLSSWSCFNASH